MPYLAIGCGALLALVFVVSAVSKMRSTEFGSFVASLRQLPVVPDRMARPYAAAVLATEVTIPLLLATGTAAIAGFALAAGLLTVFSVGIAVSVRRGSRVPCRCFAASDTPLGDRHVVRNSILVVAAVTGGLATTSGGVADLHPTPVVIALTAAGCIAALVIRFDDMADLFIGPLLSAAREKEQR